MSKSNKSTAIDNVSDITPSKASQPNFTYDSNTKFLSVDNLPSDWQQNQSFLESFSAAKNSNPGCRGASIGAEHVTVVFREGSFRTRAARGEGNSAGHNVARKAVKLSPMDQLLNDPDSLRNALSEEHGRLSTRLAQVDSMLSALNAKIAG